MLVFARLRVVFPWTNQFFIFLFFPQRLVTYGKITDCAFAVGLGILFFF